MLIYLYFALLPLMAIGAFFFKDQRPRFLEATVIMTLAIGSIALLRSFPPEPVIIFAVISYIVWRNRKRFVQRAGIEDYARTELKHLYDQGADQDAMIQEIQTRRDASTDRTEKWIWTQLKHRFSKPGWERIFAPKNA